MTNEAFPGRVSWKCLCGATTFAVRLDGDRYLVAPHLGHGKTKTCEMSSKTVESNGSVMTTAAAEEAALRMMNPRVSSASVTSRSNIELTGAINVWRATEPLYRDAVLISLETVLKREASKDADARIVEHAKLFDAMERLRALAKAAAK